MSKIHDQVFQYIHGRNLIYNTCWEDPRIDRALLQIDSASELVMITSAGCNALDYLLDLPKSIFAVDVNYRQNALFELKRQFFNSSTYEELFQTFGNGRNPHFKEVLRKFDGEMPAYARLFWERRAEFFEATGWRDSFYFRGGAGNVAFLISQYLRRLGNRLWEQLEELFQCIRIEDQRENYDLIEPKLFSSPVRWGCRQPLAMSLLGVPRAQMELIERQYPDLGLTGYIQDCLRRVFTEVPIADNYFWRVYLTGEYTQDCCPNYLREENFESLRENLHRVQTSCSTLAQFLAKKPGQYSHFILLDHQDWLAKHVPAALEEEWRLILDNSRPGAKILMRSAAFEFNFIPEFVMERIRVLEEPAQTLHRRDRVGTYGGLLLAEVN